MLHLFERDCSTQRRHQKVLEEAPGPTVDPDLRHRLTGAAVALATEVGYTGAGTVEFLLDNDTGDFYFLEMNTRLQVEHPVTEATVLVRGEGLDLVEEQLRVATGVPLRFVQDDVTQSGHAIEARVYAEDSFGGFLPQAGATSLVQWATGEGVRVDHALEPGQVVSTAYDPMLGKIVAHGPDRETARRALVAALDDTAILGLTTNAGFLRALVASDEFRDATIDTAWLDRHDVPAPDADVPRVMAAWISAMLAATDTGHPFQRDGFRLGAEPAPTIVALDREVVVDRHRGTVDGVPVQQVSAENHVLELAVDGHTGAPSSTCRPTWSRWSFRGQRHVLDRARPAGRPRRRQRRHRAGADARHGARGPGRRGRDGRRRAGARHDGGDEDGAHAEGAVRRHGHRRGRGRRRPGAAGSHAVPVRGPGRGRGRGRVEAGRGRVRTE